MALPSQSHARASSWRTAPSGGSSNSISGLIARNKSVLVAALAAAGAIGGYLYLRGRTPAESIAGTSDTFLPPGQTAESAARPLGESAPRAVTADNAGPAPVTISMGSLKESAGTSGGSKPSLEQLLAEAAQPKADPAQPATATPGGQPASRPAIIDPTAAPAPTPTPQPSQAFPSATGSDARPVIEQASRLVQQNNPVEARKVLNDALLNPALSPESRGQLRTQIGQINQTLFFSPTPYKNDTVTDEYSVVSGDSLARIVRRQGLPIDWRLLMRINKLPNENSLRVGQRLKVVRQPLHAVVHKRDYRMDVYAGPPASPGTSPGPDGQDPSWTYITSYRVGLGADNGTPEGLYAVRANSKLVNPRWVNPRTGEVFEADDPLNPIGERWIGLEGIDENTRKFAGYGVHGTIDPESIGQQKSMGCVRLLAPDVEIVYEMLVDKISTVKVVQ